MRIVFAFIVGIVVLLAVAFYRYGEVYSERSRAEAVSVSECMRARGAPVYDEGRSPIRQECQRSFSDAWEADSTMHYFLGAWLWGIIAGLVAGLITWMMLGRRQRTAKDSA